MASAVAPTSSEFPEQSLLSDRAIMRHMEQGTVVISPFVRANLATSSYDVTLGRFYFRETRAEPGVLGIYNPYSEEMVRKIWGKAHEAEKAKVWTARTGIALENIDGEEEIIWLAPGETILGHTNEFIVTTMMKARSSMGRNFIEVCKPVLGPSYERDGKYQQSDNVDDLLKAWGPEAMLPKMYKDREVREAAARRESTQATSSK